MEFIKNLSLDFIDLLPFSKRPFRAKFIPSKVWNDLDKYRNNSQGLINYSKKWKTCIKFLRNPSNSKFYQQYIAIGGEYDADTRKNTILIYHNEYDKFVFSEHSWNRFKYKFIQTIMHEFIHFMQYDRRYDEGTAYHYQYKRSNRRKIEEDRNYYSHFDEIQAYAHCIYLDYRCKYPNKTVEELLTTCKYRSNSPTLTSILKTFDHDFKNNDCLHKMLSEVYKWHRRYERYYFATLNS